jgi:hypothetical protein
MRFTRTLFFQYANCQQTNITLGWVELNSTLKQGIKFEFVNEKMWLGGKTPTKSGNPGSLAEINHTSHH